LEPGTNPAISRQEARAQGRIIELAPGERRRYDLEIGALVGQSEIQTFAARVSKLAGA